MYAQKKPIDNAHIVRERDRQRFRELIALLGLGIPIGLFLLLFTWQNLEVIRLGHEATRLQKQRREIENANKVTITATVQGASIVRAKSMPESRAPSTTRRLVRFDPTRRSEAAFDMNTVP